MLQVQGRGEGGFTPRIFLPLDHCYHSYSFIHLSLFICYGCLTIWVCRLIFLCLTCGLPHFLQCQDKFKRMNLHWTRHWSWLADLSDHQSPKLMASWPQCISIRLINYEVCIFHGVSTPYITECSIFMEWLVKHKFRDVKNNRLDRLQSFPP